MNHTIETLTPTEDPWARALRHHRLSYPEQQLLFYILSRPSFSDFLNLTWRIVLFILFFNLDKEDLK